jgi:hypothetical protein
MAASPRGRRRGGFPLVTFFIRPNSVKKPKGKPGSCTARSLKHTRPTCMETWQELSNYDNSWNFKPSEGAQFSWMHHMAWGSADRYTEVFTPLFVFYVAIQDHARDLADFHFLEIIKAYFFLWLWIKYQWLLFFFSKYNGFQLRLLVLHPVLLLRFRPDYVTLKGFFANVQILISSISSKYFSWGGKSEFDEFLFVNRQKIWSNWRLSLITL